MSRSRATRRDPTQQAALSFEGTELVPVVLDTLSEQQAMLVAARFGLTGDSPAAWAAMCRSYGLDSHTANAIMSKAISKLRHPSRASVLGVWENGVRVDFVSARGAASLRPSGGLEWCRQCHEVPVNIREDHELSKGGRKRDYCSNACRQAAYRARRKAAVPPA